MSPYPRLWFGEEETQPLEPLLVRLVCHPSRVASLPNVSGHSLASSAIPTPGSLERRQQHEGALGHALATACSGGQEGAFWTGTCCWLGRCVTFPGHNRGGATNPVPGPGSSTPPNQPPATQTPPARTPPLLSSSGVTEPASTSTPESTTTSSSSTTPPSASPNSNGRLPTSTRAVTSTLSSAGTAVPDYVASATTVVRTQTEVTLSISVSDGRVSSLTTAASPSLSPPPNDGAVSHGIRPGVIAAIVPVVVVVLVLCASGFWICRRRRARKAEASSWREIDSTWSDHFTEISSGTRSWFWGSEGGGSAAAPSASRPSNPNVRALVAAFFSHRPATSMSQHEPEDRTAVCESEKRAPDVPMDVTAEGSILQTAHGSEPCHPESDCYVLSSPTSLFSGSAHAV
ncbi:hypothetical protein C8T65DRAFT_217310 [Cerioporus squamosus]|nr:hypothetical protein C8T65DRAFT_217310 [Cerioporus squamosus]